MGIPIIALMANLWGKNKKGFLTGITSVASWWLQFWHACPWYTHTQNVLYEFYSQTFLGIPWIHLRWFHWNLFIRSQVIAWQTDRQRATWFFLWSRFLHPHVRGIFEVMSLLPSLKHHVPSVQFPSCVENTVQRGRGKFCHFCERNK